MSFSDYCLADGELTLRLHFWHRLRGASRQIAVDQVERRLAALWAAYSTVKEI